jgi:AcrR family transcriptional regulator
MGKAEETKQFIIEKTAPIFNKKGFSGTTMTDLTSATGLTKGAIYGNFSNKDEVAIEAFIFNRDVLWSKISKAISKARSPKDKLINFLEFYKNNIDYFIKQGGCALLNTSVDSDDTHPQLFKVVQNTFDNWRKEITKIVVEAQESGQINVSINPKEFAGLMITVVEGSILMSKTLNDISILDSNFEFLKSQMT